MSREIKLLSVIVAIFMLDSKSQNKKFQKEYCNFNKVKFRLRRSKNLILLVFHTNERAEDKE